MCVCVCVCVCVYIHIWCVCEYIKMYVSHNYHCKDTHIVYEND